MYYISEFVENHLIAYIGNKRRLLSLIKKAIENTGIIPSKKRAVKFLDLFSGTGVVSRLAKYMGFEVTSNDWEYYSYIINKTFLTNGTELVQNGFKELGGIESAIEVLNSLDEPRDKDRYISVNYCPQNDYQPDTDNERMFYTNFNGKKIDAIRAKIAEWHFNNLICDNENDLLVAILLYEASTRSNTSGVFKGFHKGFGGANGDALGRILKRVELTKPVLIDGPKSRVYNEDALTLACQLKNEQFDIVYLDPPYNQHQYGSNYHLLNTIALNDKPPVNKNVMIEGKKINKSAIRKDWIKTKSNFCYKKSALEDFKKLIRNINAKNILISYSTDGIIDFNDMLSVLSEKGKLDITLSEYVKFRGGKQAITTTVNNIEFVLSVDTKQRGSIKDIERVKKILGLNKIEIMLKKVLSEIRGDALGFTYSAYTGSEYLVVDSVLNKSYGNHKIELLLLNSRVINAESIINSIQRFSFDQLEQLCDDLTVLSSLTKEDEIYISISNIFKLYKNESFADMATEFKMIPYNLSKFNNKKAYIPSLKAIVRILEMMIQTSSVWTGLNIIKNSGFNKLEKIILQKLNVKVTEKIKPECSIKTVDGYKEKIALLYESLIGILEHSEGISVKTRSIKPVPFVSKKVAAG